MTKRFEVSKITKISFKLNLNILNGAKAHGMLFVVVLQHREKNL